MVTNKEANKYMNEMNRNAREKDSTPPHSLSRYSRARKNPTTGTMSVSRKKAISSSGDCIPIGKRTNFSVQKIPITVPYLMASS